VAPKATLTLQPGLGIKDANINAHLVVKIEDPWFEIEIKDRKDPTKTTKPNIGVRTMLSMGALKAFVQDGQFGIALVGPLGKLKPRLVRPRTRVGGPGIGGGRKVNVDHPADEPDEGDDDSGAAPRTPPPAVVAPEPAKARSMPGGGARPAQPVVRTPTGISRSKPGGRFDRPRPKIVTDELMPEPHDEPGEDLEAIHDMPEPGNGGEIVDDEAPIDDGHELPPDEHGEEGDFQ
jgi:hypothetical protein